MLSEAKHLVCRARETLRCAQGDTPFAALELAMNEVIGVSPGEAARVTPSGTLCRKERMCKAKNNESIITAGK